MYVLFRTKALRMFHWFSLLGIDEFIFLIRENLSQLKILLPPWVYYSLPDALWVYAFSSSFLILWEGRLNLWLSIPFFTGVLVEIAQGVKIFPGTFDLIDLCLTSISLVLSILVMKSKFNYNEKTNS